MVFLTMTSAILEALGKLEARRQTQTVPIKEDENEAEDGSKASRLIEVPEQQRSSPTTARETVAREEIKSSEPTLSDPKIGNPISHGQIIEIAQAMKAEELQPQSLETLLKGAKVYIPPAAQKPEPTTEYKALMARLRRDEEARSYERMTNPPPQMETFNQRFPRSSAAHAFSGLQNINTSDPDDDGLTFADVDKQMALILNVLLSIVACAAAIWIAARWWSTPARLAVSMSGGMLVGVAEVVVYSGYIRRVGEAKGKEKSLKEVKEIVKTWAVGAGQKDEISEHNDKSIIIEANHNDTKLRARRRHEDQS